MSNIRLVLAGFVSILPLMGCAAPGPTGAHLDPRADEQLRAVGRTLGAARQFGFRERCAQEVIVGPQGPATVATERRIRVRRPDRLAADLTSGAARRRTWFDGRSLVNLDVERKAYARLDGVQDLDGLVDRLRREFDYRNPLGALLAADPYRAIRAELLGASYAGMETVAGRSCHRLACRHPAADWDVWIDAAAAVPVRLMIRYTDDSGRPVHDAVFDEWNLSAQFAAAEFEPRLPPDAYEIEVLELTGLP